MVKVKVPAELCRRVSTRAMNYAQTEMHRRGWSESTIRRLYIANGDGIVGIASPDKHIFYQERGIRSFLMHSLEGKKVPIGDRILTVKDVGKPGFVHIPRPGGGPDIVKWRNQKWKHPGIKPQNILKDSISRAILEERAGIQTEIQRRLEGR